MKRRAIVVSVAFISLSLAFLAGACSGGEEKPVFEPLLQAQENYFGVKSELVAEAKFPAVFAFAPDGRLFYNELLTGDMRIITPDGSLLEEPFAHVDIVTGQEYGLIGLAIDPEFETNHYIYIYFTAPAGEEGGAIPTVMRFTDADNTGIDPKVILELPRTIPGQPFHVGGNIHFGPDGYLYVTVGDNVQPELAQDLSAPQGKILRIDKEDGSAAPDNPFVDDPQADPRVFAYGLRNSFDFTFHPETGEIYATENSEQVCDELNLVTKGGNYGWPTSEPPEGTERTACGNPGAIEAIHFFTGYLSLPPTHRGAITAPTGIEFVSRVNYPRLNDSLLVCSWITGAMRHFMVQGAEGDVLIVRGTVVTDCKLDIVLDPNGIVYYSNETEIRRLAAAEVEEP